MLLLKNNCSAYKDIFSALDAQANDNETLFLDGEIGTEKEEFAKYIHYQAQKTEENFVSVQLNLLTPDQHENEVISSELNKITNNRKHTTIFLSGYSKLKSQNQKEVQNFLQKGLLGQEIKFIVGINHNKTDKKLKKMKNCQYFFLKQPS